MVPALPDALARWAAGVIILAGVGGYAGWSVRGRIAANVEARMQARIDHLQNTVDQYADRINGWQRDYETVRRNAAALERAIAEQSAAVDRLSAAYFTAEARRRDAERRLRDHLANQPAAPTIAPGTCEAMVEQARRAAGGGR